MPFAEYKDMDDCVAKNQDKDDPKGYCATAMRKVEGKEMEKHKPRSQTKMLDAPLPPGNFTRLKNGALKVTGIVALAEGTWTDSAVGTPLYYPPKVLEKDAGNWVTPGIWARHPGGTSRPITDKIGTVKNPRYDAESKAIIVDGIFHGRSQASRDVIDLIEEGIVTDVSAEVGGREVWNPETKRYEAASLAFYGLATVDRGACTVCQMKRNEASTERETKEQEERTEMEAKELEQKVAALEAEKVELARKAETEKVELTKQLETVSKARVDDESARGVAMKALEAKVADYEKRIKELEKTPVPPITRPGNGESAAKPNLELEMVSPAKIWNGEVSRA